MHCRLTLRTDLGEGDDKHYGEWLADHWWEIQPASAVGQYFCSINKLHNEIGVYLYREQTVET